MAEREFDFDPLPDHIADAIEAEELRREFGAREEFERENPAAIFVWALAMSVALVVLGLLVYGVLS